jgi:ribose transport system substrate-binding protein
MKIHKWMGLALTAAALALVGCGQSGEKETAEPTKPATAKKEGVVWPKDTLRITMIAKADNNPVFPTAHKGASDEADKLKAETGIDITIDWRTPPTENPEEQANRVRQAITEKTDVLLISVSDAAKLTGAINDAVDAGIPVMTFDSDAPDSKRFAFYGADDIECGTLVMKTLAELTGGKANVAILAGSQNAPNLQKRVQGAKDEAAKYKNIKIVDIFYHVEDAQSAADKVLQTMKAYPQIDAWCMVGGWPLFTKSLMTLTPGKVKIVAIDCLPPELGYIDSGIAPVLFAQPTYKWGSESVKLIVDKLVYGKTVEPINKMPLERIDKARLKEWAKQLNDWGLTGIDPKYLQ